VHFSVTDDNAHELESMIAFCRSSGAAVLNVFFLVCTGRGETFTNISLETYENTLRRVAEAARDENELLVRARCAPHFKRMALEMNPPLPVTLIHGYEAGGCLAGTRYCRVTPTGGITACPYIEESVGSIRETAFANIWRDAPMFNALREPKLEGRCGACEYSKLCGGCRARPFAKHGALMGEDFLCGYCPSGGATIEPMLADSAVPWTQDAEDRLARVPGFVRRFVRKRAETHAREIGDAAVTAEHLDELARRRFGNSPPFARPEALAKDNLSRSGESGRK
jgi:radical SAM protein with 4Fe4S-binding SPASM domain